MFRTVRLSIIRSFSLYTQQWYMSYSVADTLRAGSGWNSVPSWSCSQAVSIPVWHTPLMSLEWKTPGDGQRNCPKHVDFHSKNKFEKLVHLVGFIIRNLTRCTVTWKSNSTVTLDYEQNIKKVIKGKGKAIPLQAWRGPECSRRLKLPDFKTIGTWRW